MAEMHSVFELILHGHYWSLTSLAGEGDSKTSRKWHPLELFWRCCGKGLSGLWYMSAFYANYKFRRKTKNLSFPVKVFSPSDSQTMVLFGEYSPLSEKKERKKVKSLSHVQLFATPWTCSPPGSSVHGIFQARILEWVAISVSKRSSWLRDWTRVSYCRQTLYCLSHQGSLKRGYY